MPRAKKDDHIHKYKKDILGKDYVIYRCVLPGCTHYLPERLIKGKFCVCWRCGEPFIIKLLHSKPHCDDCIEKKKPEIDEDFVGRILSRS